MKVNLFQKESGISAAIFTFFWKSLGFVISFLKHIFIAGIIGLSSQLDIFYMAIAIIGVLVSSWAHVFDIISIPQIIKKNKLEDKEELNIFIGSMLSFSLIISFILFLIFLLFPSQISLMAYGLDENRKKLMLESFIWLLPAIIIFLPLSFMGSILKAFRRFSLMYLIEIIGSIIVLFCIYYFINSKNVLYWSYSLSIIIPFIITFLIVRLITNLRFSNPFSNSIKYLISSFFPLFILHGSNYIFIFSDRFFASFLNTGDISALAYATTLVLAIPIAIGIPYYFLTIYADEESHAEKNRKTNDMFSLAIFISIFAITFFYLCGNDFITILFERGAFSNNDTKKVNGILFILSLMLLPLLAQRAIDQIYQVENKVYIIVRRTIAGLLLNLFLNYYFIFEFDLGIEGVALATTLSNWLILILALVNLKSININVYWKSHLLFFSWLSFLALSIIFIYNFILIDRFNDFIELLLTTILISCIITFGSLVYSGRERQLIILVLNKFINFKKML